MGRYGTRAQDATVRTHGCWALQLQRWAVKISSPLLWGDSCSPRARSKNYMNAFSWVQSMWVPFSFNTPTVNERLSSQRGEGCVIQRTQSLLLTALVGTQSVSVVFQTREAITEALNVQVSRCCRRLNLKCPIPKGTITFKPYQISLVLLINHGTLFNLTVVEALKLVFWDEALYHQRLSLLHPELDRKSVV